MTVNELSRNELIELKQRYYSEKEENVSYVEISVIDKLVSDEEVFSAYGNIEFTEEDFFCNLDKAGEEEIENINTIEEER